MASSMPQPPAGSPQPAARGFNFNDFISFRFLITPALITVVYVIGAILVTLAALASLAAGGSSGFLAGLLILIFGNLYWRVILEFIVVLFKMNDALQSIDRRGRGM